MEATTVLNQSTAWGGAASNSLYDWWNPNTYVPLVLTSYINYIPYWESDRTGRAMRLIQTLMEKKLMEEPKTVGKFIELVNTVAGLL